MKINSLPKQADLREYFRYDEIEHELYYIKKPKYGRIDFDKPAGSVRHPRGYRRIRFCAREHYAHRLNYIFHHGDESIPNGWIVDHVDGNTRNNDINNLMTKTGQDNDRKAKMKGNNVSGFKGVSFDIRAQKWRANIRVDKVLYNVGSFGTPEEAHLHRQSYIMANGMGDLFPMYNEYSQPEAPSVYSHSFFAEAA